MEAAEGLPLLELPVEVLWMIFRHVGAEDLMACAAVSRQWYSLSVAEDALWHMLCQDFLRLRFKHIPYARATGRSWRQYFRQLFRYRWDMNRCGISFMVSDKGRTVTQETAGGTWQSVALMKAHKRGTCTYSVQINAGTAFGIGLTRSGANMSCDMHMTPYAWSLWNTGLVRWLTAQGQQAIQVNGATLNVGDVVTVVVDMDKGTARFLRNGVRLVSLSGIRKHANKVYFTISAASMGMVGHESASFTLV